MLVLTQKVGEEIHIGGQVILTVIAVNGNQVRLGVQAPAHVTVRRAELNCFVSDMKSRERKQGLRP
jgi:carbon storage regulator